jgi:hypothetical protein
VEKFFNTAGPCDPKWHYMLPPERRLPDAGGLIDRGQYFVVHAPRQTSKTTSLRALARKLNKDGRFIALHFSCETAEPAGDDYVAAQRAILGAIAGEARIERLADDLQPPITWSDAQPENLLATGLTQWAEQAPRPLVLFFDEIGALRGQSLRSVLRQLRAGYPSRPLSFPWSVVLCGLRDVRDYKAASGGDPTRLGTSSPFNIKVESLRVGDFTEDDMRALYAQHTEATGQEFTEHALVRAFGYSRGQPWLVNALAREIVDKIEVRRDAPILAEHVDQAKERLVVARATHLDSLAARLREPRVRRIIEPLIVGDVVPADDTYDDDVSYVRDLGLLASGRPIRIANPIYREVIPRVLGARTEDSIVDDPKSFIQPDGRLDFNQLLLRFTHFWRQHGEVLLRGSAYQEAAPQLIIMAFVQAIVNGGGFIDREYGVGRGRVDLLVRWPYRKADGEQDWQREAVELKVRRGRLDPTAEGIEQLDGYLEGLGLTQGTLVVFDQRPDAPELAERDISFDELKTKKGRRVTLLRA